VRLAITTSGATSLALSGVDRNIAITPDGSHVIYRGNNQLLVRALDQLEPTVLSGLGNPLGPFTSPDGLWVGFFDAVYFLKKVPITGGLPGDTVRHSRPARGCHVG
jgi:serine/threonine-protein kinase